MVLVHSAEDDRFHIETVSYPLALGDYYAIPSVATVSISPSFLALQ